MNPEYVYLDYDNTIVLELRESGENITSAQYASITRMTLKFGETVVDSNATGSGNDTPFDWSSGSYLVLRLRAVVPQEAKVYNRVEHVVYSADNPDGVVWGYLKIIVI